MPFESATYINASERVLMLNDLHRHHAGISVLKSALSHPLVGRTALVSSFGAESVVLLHMVSIFAPETPVILIDTQFLFEETLQYQAELTDRFGLVNMQRISTGLAEIKDPNGSLHQTNPDSCCHFRKVEPLQTALAPYDAWITGRKRFQTQDRANLEHFEAETDARIKINPLAHWRPEDVQDYIVNNNLPKHPLVEDGFTSIGCAPCTSAVTKGQDPRAGRWAGQEKSECGIHFENGRLIKGGQSS